MNINRMLVTPHDSHITEQRRIEDKIEEGKKRLRGLASQLDEELYDGRWLDASDTARTMALTTDYIEKLTYRLTDVQDINEQFRRIQVHIDRIEAQLKTQGDK
jgi:uncharacterized protein YicC (UPF0701 family)